MSNTVWIDSRNATAPLAFSRHLRCLLNEQNPSLLPIAFICVGSANIAGDDFGPLLGDILKSYHCRLVYGSSDNPCNAPAIMENQSLIQHLDQHFFLIAIDIAIGHAPQCGYVTLTPGSLRPGSALSKELPAFGRLHITGVVPALNRSAYFYFRNFYRTITPGLMAFADYKY